MNVFSIIAFLSGAAGVWLTIKKSIWCWPLALVSVVASALEFYDQRLYGDMSLQVVYFFAGLYGWYYWHQRSKESFQPERTATGAWIWLLLLTLLQGLLYFVILKKLGGDQVVLDAALTAASLTATYMMTRRWLENWLAWVIIDAVYVVLYALKQMWWFGALYLLFALMAWYGYCSWKKQGRSN